MFCNWLACCLQIPSLCKWSSWAWILSSSVLVLLIICKQLRGRYVNWMGQYSDDIVNNKRFLLKLMFSISQEYSSAQFPNYKSGMQTSPLTFMAIFEACRLILAPKHMFPLILLGLRILKWGETFLKVNFGIIYGYFKGPGGNSMWLRPSQK